MTAYPPPGVPACSSSVGHVAAGGSCPVCGHSGYAHPPMSAGPCGICEAVVDARDAVAELVVDAQDAVAELVREAAKAVVAMTREPQPLPHVAVAGEPPSGRRPRHRAP